MALEGPIGNKVGFAVSTRALHDLGASVLGSSHNPYGYRDALGRVDVELGNDHLLSTTAFWNHESVRLSVDGGSATPSTPLPGPEDASRGNQALTVAYRGILGDVTLDAAASASGYQADLPLVAREKLGTVPAGLVPAAGKVLVLSVRDLANPDLVCGGGNWSDTCASMVVLEQPGIDPGRRPGRVELSLLTGRRTWYPQADTVTLAEAPPPG